MVERVHSAAARISDLGRDGIRRAVLTETGPALSIGRTSELRSRHWQSVRPNNRDRRMRAMKFSVEGFLREPRKLRDPLTLADSRVIRSSGRIQTPNSSPPSP